MSHGPPVARPDSAAAGDDNEAAEAARIDAHLARRGMRVRAVRDIFEIIAFSAAGIWALWTFWYQASYEPSHAQPLVEWNIELEREAVRPSDGMLAIKAHIRGVNKGKASLHLVSMNVTMTGGHITRSRATKSTWEPISPDAGSWQRDLGAHRDEGTLLGSQGNRWGGTYQSIIDPEQEHDDTFLFWVDPTDYDFVHAELVVRSSPDASFERGWFEAEVDDAGAVSVVPTEACRVAQAACHRGLWETEVELPLWPAAAGDSAPRKVSSPPGSPVDGGAP